MYDEEAIYQDADIEQMQYEAESRELRALRRAGYCSHQSGVGLPESGEIFYPEQVGLKPGQQRCTDGCGTVFDSLEELWDAEPIRIA